jgi:hypothetical protein
MTKVNYVAVEDGCIEFYAGVGNMVVKSNDVLVLVKAVIDAGGFADTVYGSSSCDFATEYGFPTQVAYDNLFDEVYELVEQVVA